MDIATIVGIIAGVILIVLSIMSGGGLNAFIEPASMLVVIGGTIAATLINYPLPEMIGVIGVVKKAFLYKAPDPRETIKQIVKFAEVARREGILALEDQMNTVDDDFLLQGLQLAVDGTEPELMRTILGTEISYLQDRHEAGKGIFQSMGNYAPAFGMIGTLIGLVLMLSKMDDPAAIGPGMAVALITTFYGAVLANLVFLPIAGKLKTRSKQEVMNKELLMEGVLSIQSGDNPRIVEQKLISFLPPKVRGDLATK